MAALISFVRQRSRSHRGAPVRPGGQSLVEFALVLPLFTVNSLYLNAPKVKGFSFDLEGYPWLYDVSLAQ